MTRSIFRAAATLTVSSLFAAALWLAAPAEGAWPSLGEGDTPVIPAHGLWSAAASEREVIVTAGPGGATAVPPRGVVACSGLVRMAQYGQAEDVLAFRDRGYLAVRFDPPFRPPYTIASVSFPSFTKDGQAAIFPSLRICGANARGLPDIAAPLLMAAPFVGSSDGLNEVPVNLAVGDSGRIFYVCVEFPTTTSSTFPNGFPYLRMDYRDHDLGYFGNSAQILPSGQTVILSDRNLIADMSFQLNSWDAAPIESSSNTGANELDDKVEFRFQEPRDLAADGCDMPVHSLLRTDLLRRLGFGPWTPVASTGSGSNVIELPDTPENGALWGTQAVDKNGNRAILSNVTVTASHGSGLYDGDEPNGRVNQATIVSPPITNRDETCFPAGDQDYFSFLAGPDEVIAVGAAATARDGVNDLALVLLLYNGSGALLATSDPAGGPAPQLSYFGNSSHKGLGKAARKYTLLVSDVRGSKLSPMTAPRVVLPFPTYVLTIQLQAPEVPSVFASAHGSGDGLTLRIQGSGSGHTTKLAYELPVHSQAGDASLRIYDVHGRLVRTLAPVLDGGGEYTAQWDGTDQNGQRVASGTYFARVRAGSNTRSARITHVR